MDDRGLSHGRIDCTLLTNYTIVLDEHLPLRTSFLVSLPHLPPCRRAHLECKFAVKFV
jgi:hypothetical protein